MSSSNRSSPKTKTILKAKSEKKIGFHEKSPSPIRKQLVSDLRNQNEQLQIQNDHLKGNIEDLKSKCAAILKHVFGTSTGGDCSPADISFSGLVNQPLPEMLVKLSSLQKKPADIGTLSSRVEELETRLTSHYNEITKLLQIKMKVESCLEHILMLQDLSEAKNIARKTLDECNDVCLFVHSTEIKMLNTELPNSEIVNTEHNSADETENLLPLTKPSKKFPGDTHISKIDPNLKKHIFQELNQETKKGNDWRLLAERVGIEAAIIDVWKAHKLDSPMMNVWSVWSKSSGATLRMLHRHLISPQMKNSLLARKVSDFYLVS